jgi:hypothetical protein
MTQKEYKFCEICNGRIFDGFLDYEPYHKCLGELAKNLTRYERAKLMWKSAPSSSACMWEVIEAADAEISFWRNGKM